MEGNAPPMTAPRSCARPPTCCASAIDHVSKVMTQEQGKVYVESRAEVLTSADIIDWYAEEGRRTYGRVIPGRQKGVRQLVVAGAGRRRCGVHAVEFPDADAGAQDRRRARGRLLDHHQGVGGDAGRLRRAGANASPTPACRRACSISCSACRRMCPSI